MLRVITLTLTALLAAGEIRRVADPFSSLEPVAPVLSSSDTSARRSIFDFFRSPLPAEPRVSILKSAHGVRLQPMSETEHCDFYPEIVLVQDVTQSFKDDMKNLQRLMPQLFDFFKTRFDGHVRFGITSFADKYVPPTIWGMKSDYCAKVHMPLTDVSDAEAMQRAQDTFQNIKIRAGGDYNDGANEGIVRAALSEAVGWRNITHDPATGRPILRLLVIATDASIHEAGYAQELVNLTPPLPPHNLVANPSIIAEDIDAECSAMDYPTGEDIAAVLDARNIIPIVFSGNPKQTGYNRIWAQYKKEWVTRYNQKGWWDDLELGLARFYGDYFVNVVKRDAVVQLIDETSSNFIEVFERAMSEVTNLTCIPPATTTQEPTTITTTLPETTLPSTEAPIVTSTEIPPTSHSTKVEETTEKPSTAISLPSTMVVTEEVSLLTDDETHRPQSSTASVGTPLPPVDPEVSNEGNLNTPSTEGTLLTTAAAESTTTTTTTTTEEKKGNVAVIGSAAGGGAVVAAAAALAAAKKFGILFNGNSVPDLNITTDVETPEVTTDREQFEAVTGDLFA